MKKSRKYDIGKIENRNNKKGEKSNNFNIEIIGNWESEKIKNWKKPNSKIETLTKIKKNKTVFIKEKTKIEKTNGIRELKKN